MGQTMVTQRRPSAERCIRAVVPSVASWRTYRGAFLNLLVFVLAAAGGEWLVHQVEYLIEYGPRFGTVMARTPHHAYMGPIGVVLMAAGALFLAVSIGVLLGLWIQRRRLVAHLPARLSRSLSQARPGGFVQAFAGTSLALAAIQTALYVGQENLEAFALWRSWPGLAVLLGPQHLTALPLHLLVAGLSAVLLCSVARVLHGSRRAVEAARTLLALSAFRGHVAHRLRPLRRHIPNLRLIAGLLCLRSPPLAA